MIFYNITASMPVKPDWASISGDLKAGTPLSIGGKVANDDAAFGLVQEDTAHGAEYVKVVYAGVADLAGASKSYGSAVSDDAVQAMNGLTFIYGGKIYNVVPSGLPDSSEASQGDVLTIGSSGPEWDAPSGGGGGAYIVDTTYNGSYSNATHDSNATDAEDIFDALSSGLLPVLCLHSTDPMAGSAVDDYQAFRSAAKMDGDVTFVAFGSDDYPTYVLPDGSVTDSM